MSAQLQWPLETSTILAWQKESDKKPENECRIPIPPFFSQETDNQNISFMD